MTRAGMLCRIFTRERLIDMSKLHAPSERHPGVVTGK